MRNHPYSDSPCTYEKCPGLWHDQTQTPEWKKPRRDISSNGQKSSSQGKVDGAETVPKYDNGVCKEECDCGSLPCGEYVW